MLDPLWTHLPGRFDRSKIAINELAQTNVQISERYQVPWSSANQNKHPLISTDQIIFLSSKILDKEVLENPHLFH